jgi:lysophospholipase L1-like esterase
MSSFENDFQAWRRSRADALMEDFGELSRYRDANAALKPPAAGEERIVFFGDSITEGWNLEKYFPGRPYLNRGIGGQTTAQMLIRFRQDVIGLSPQAAVILAGTNDIGGNTGPVRLEDAEANCASMAEIARANGVRVIFCSLLPPAHECTLLSRYNLLKHPPEHAVAMNRWLKDYSAANGAGFVDYFAALSGATGLLKPEYSEDGLHPSEAGYWIMAPLAQAAIGEAQGRGA